jgi:Sulfotransferase domain
MGARSAPLSQKVFGIGFQKTGTSSLNRALAILGYNAVGGIRINHPKGIAITPPLTKEKVLSIALARAREADAFSDNPWPLLYQELDAAFPGSKFVLTHRDPDRWLESMVRHFGDTPSDVMVWIYGTPYPKGNEARCVQVYAAHNDGVRAYFAGRPNDLLDVDFESGDGWLELCAFLDRPVPPAAFPHDNSGEERERKRTGLWRRMKERVRGAFAS